MRLTRSGWQGRVVHLCGARFPGDGSGKGGYGGSGDGGGGSGDGGGGGGGGERLFGDRAQAPTFECVLDSRSRLPLRGLRKVGQLRRSLRPV